MIADAHASVKISFSNHRLVRVLVLSYLTSNEGLNLDYNCRNSIMVEQGKNYSMEHQVWLRIRQIGQQQKQRLPRLVSHTTIHWVTENTHQMKQ